MNKCNYCVNVAQDTINKVAACNLCFQHSMYEYDFHSAGKVFEELLEEQEEFVKELYK